MTDQSLERLYGLDRETRPRGALPAALAFILRHAVAVSAGVLVLTVISGYLASTLDLVTDFAQLIPDDTRSVIDRKKGEKYLGNTSLHVVAVEASGDNAGERARRAAIALSDRVSTDREFDFVLHRFDRDFFERHAFLYMSVEDLKDLYQRLDKRIREEVLDENPLFIDLMDDDDDDDDDESGDGGDDSGSGESGDGGGGSDDSGSGESGKPAAGEPDILEPETLRELYFEDREELEAREYLVDESGTTYLVLIRPLEPPIHIEYNRFVLTRVQEHIDALKADETVDSGVVFTFSGNYRSITEENDAVKDDLQKASLISGVLLLAVVLFYFRRKRALWVVFLPLLAGVIVMMGYVKLSVGRLNTITGFCFALFMGLSIDFAIHFLARYDEERGKDRSVFDALLQTYRETGKASLSAATTSSVGFLALVAADFKGFREFGIIAGGGIVICLGIIAILLPAIIALSVRFSEERRFASFNPDRASRRQRPPMARTLVLVAVVGLAALGWRATHIDWEDDFRNLRGGTPENLEIAERVLAILGRSTQPAVRIADSLDEAKKLADACNAERDRRGPDSAVKHCLSLANFLPTDQKRKLPVIKRIKELLNDNRLNGLDDDEKREELRRLRDETPEVPLTEADLPKELVTSFVSADGTKYLMKAYPSQSTWKVSTNIRLSTELLAGDDVSQTDIGPIGSAMIMADLMEVMKYDSVMVVVIALIAVFLVLLALFRSGTKALACYLPLLLSLVATIGAMEVIGMRLGLFNMIVLPSLIGLGVDNNIHLFHRYHVEGRGSWPYTIRTTGVACLMAAVTTMAGFVGLVLAGHRGLNTIGDLAILGIITATVISLIFLPAVITIIESRIKGRGFGVFPGHEFTGGDR